MIPPKKLRKSLSQHILKDKNILRKMIKISEIDKEDIVLEIGAGSGNLTELIAEKAKVVYAIEIDRDFAPFLEPLKERFDNLNLIYGDFLDFPLSSLNLKSRIKIIGNIPYKITGPILFKMIKERKHIERAFLTVQKEVGMRMKAKPGGRIYGSLSVSCQTFAEIETHLSLKSHLFVPPPKVESFFLSMKFKTHEDLDDRFLDFVRVCFSNKRKFMRHALERILDEKHIDELYKAMNFPPTVRAEQLSPELFRNMYALVKSSL